MSLPIYINSCAPFLEAQTVKKADTIYRLKNRLTAFENKQPTLQFFINCAEDLTLLGERVCLVCNINWQSSNFSPSKFIGDIVYYGSASGHRAPQEKSLILESAQDFEECLCSYDWVLFFHDSYHLAKKLHSIYGQSILIVNDEGNKIHSIWNRNKSENIVSKTDLGIFSHLNKNAKITVEEDAVTNDFFV